jgi:GNAT superfamily N-acetyltransferase
MNHNPAQVSMEIIPCAVDDAKKLSDIALRAYNDYYLYLWHDGGKWYRNRCFAPYVFEKELKEPNSAFYILKEKGETVGFLKLNIDQPLKHYEQYNCIELERIYLLKSATGKGLGRRVVEFCFDYAKKLHKEIIWLKAMDSSEAVFFYERLGFEHCGTFVLDFTQMKKEFRGMVIMMKRL